MFHCVKGRRVYRKLILVGIVFLAFCYSHNQSKLWLKQPNPHPNSGVPRTVPTEIGQFNAYDERTMADTSGKPISKLSFM